ncbi:MAG: N-acetylmuramoyl-L-alanine amidase [Steroidobacteraceae bacterium]
MRTGPSAAVVLVAISMFGIARSEAARVDGVRASAGPDSVRVVVDLSAPSTYKLFTLDHPRRVVLDLAGTTLGADVRLPRSEGAILAVRSGVQPGGALRLVIETSSGEEPRVTRLAPSADGGHRIVVDLGDAESGARTGSARVVTPVHAPKAGTRDVVIAIDAGHGGKDPGAIGHRGTHEKDVVLDIARSLAAQIDREPGMRAVLIRDGDYYIAHRERIRRARAAKADMFLSIHADALRDRHVAGASVYVLSERGATDEAARWLAERENAADLRGGVSLSDKSDVLATVLLDLSQSANISASMQAAERVLDSFDGVVPVRKPRVQQAGFLVLKSPDIPSMLIETAYITNAADEKRLRSDAQQRKLAGAIVEGVQAYFTRNPPEGTRFAELRRLASAD